MGKIRRKRDDEIGSIAVPDGWVSDPSWFTPDREITVVFKGDVRTTVKPFRVTKAGYYTVQVFSGDAIVRAALAGVDPHANERGVVKNPFMPKNEPNPPVNRIDRL